MPQAHHALVQCGLQACLPQPLNASLKRRYATADLRRHGPPAGSFAPL